MKILLTCSLKVGIVYTNIEKIKEEYNGSATHTFPYILHKQALGLPCRELWGLAPWGLTARKFLYFSAKNPRITSTKGVHSIVQ